jgi:cellulose synthase/poly-beta-1,6-N-acetylglucosamine synthase-like glycosyltransferase
MELLCQLLIWFFAFVIFYAYIGYGLVLGILVKLKGNKAFSYSDSYKPAITHIIAAYNEEDLLADKIRNSLELDYPGDAYKLLIVTDGSTDRSAEIASSHPQVTSFHEDKRSGKIAAVNRVMPYVETPLVMFSDANTFLNRDAVLNLTKHFEDPKVGVVAGEKRVMSEEKDGAAASGEGAYWKYESQLKKWDSQLYSVVGAAGELFAVRTSLYKPVDTSIIIEDFYISLRIAMDGLVTRYAPDAYAMEKGSASVSEELKRKIRIAAGGIQAIVKLLPLLNIFRYGWLSFQYISHRVLRWTLAPVGLVVVFICSLYLGLKGMDFYMWLFWAQVIFYSLALLGWILQNRNIRMKVLFIPYYFTMMNYAVFMGFFRYIRGKQSAVWEKAKRAS